MTVELVASAVPDDPTYSAVVQPAHRVIVCSFSAACSSACVGFGSGSACSDSSSHDYGPTISAHSVW